jgi:hypothetical protein
MQVSYFENGRYYAPSNLPRQWPMPAGAYDREAGLRAFRGKANAAGSAGHCTKNPVASR